MPSSCRPAGLILPLALLTLSACAPEPARVLTVGGDQHHDFDAWFDAATTATLGATGADVRYTDEPATVAPALDDLDVLYLTNNQALPEAARDGIFRFLDQGRGLMVGHAAAWYSWDDWPAYNRDLVGGGTRAHRAYGEFEVTVTDREHPVMENVPASFTITDELYRFEPDPDGPPITVLATAQEPETGEVYPIVWTVPHDRSRIVVNTLGHDGAAHDHPAYQRILQNSLRWASRAD